MATPQEIIEEMDFQLYDDIEEFERNNFDKLVIMGVDKASLDYRKKEVNEAYVQHHMQYSQKTITRGHCHMGMSHSYYTFATRVNERSEFMAPSLLT